MKVKFEWILYIVIAVGVLALAFVVYSLFFAPPQLANNAQNYQQLTAQENPSDICAVPAGMDPAQWRQHMSHHPDRYATCLQ